MQMAESRRDLARTHRAGARGAPPGGGLHPHPATAVPCAAYTAAGIERQIKGLTDEARLQARQERTVPLLTRFKASLGHTVYSVLPKDSLGEAVHDALKHWTGLP